MKYICCFYLLAGGIWDIRTKKIPSLYILLGCIGMGAFAFWQLICGQRMLFDFVISLVPGMLCYLLAKSSQTIGEGDAWVMFIMGMVLSFYELSKVLILSLFLAATGSVLIVILKKRMLNLRIPFIPFLFLAAGIVLLR